VNSNAQASTLVVTQLDSPIGPMFAVASRDGVCLLEFADRLSIATQAASVRNLFQGEIVPGTNRHTDRLVRELERYFDGKLTRFTVPLAIAGTPFQRKVWDALLAIPMGSTRTYGEIARELGCARAPRAVGRANGSNRLAILIPCHRLVQRGGSLCGYGGGLWRKDHLLNLERSAARSS
jgi:AraC family transcriptional regulator of adaptative response/methylated-DNA-[protein]-cysteine methyltransferase